MFYDQVTIFCLGYFCCLFFEQIYKLIKFTKKSYDKRWSSLKEISFTFTHENFEFEKPIAVRTIATQLVPEIMKIKSRGMDFKNIEIDKGKYDLHFDVKVSWRKK